MTGGLIGKEADTQRQGKLEFPKPQHLWWESRSYARSSIRRCVAVPYVDS